jgi:hypothetical protein
MTDALLQHVMEHGPTWLVFALMLGAQTWKLFRWLEKKFSHIDGRLDNHEQVLTGGGYARVVEKTDGTFRLEPLLTAQRVFKGERNGNGA